MKTSSSYKVMRYAGLFLLLSIFSPACKKDKKEILPSVVTVSVTDVTKSTAKIVSRTTDDGGSTITSTGVCWAKSMNPDISGNVYIAGQGLGEFTSILTGLDSSSNYFVRAFATNSVGTAYGENLTFTTQF